MKFLSFDAGRCPISLACVNFNEFFFGVTFPLISICVYYKRSDLLTTNWRK